MGGVHISPPLYLRTLTFQSESVHGPLLRIIAALYKPLQLNKLVLVSFIISSVKTFHVLCLIYFCCILSF